MPQNRGTARAVDREICSKPKKASWHVMRSDDGVGLKASLPAAKRMVAARERRKCPTPAASMPHPLLKGE